MEGGVGESNTRVNDMFAPLDSHDRASGGIASLRNSKTFDRAVLRESLVGAQERGRKVRNSHTTVSYGRPQSTSLFTYELHMNKSFISIYT